MDLSEVKNIVIKHLEAISQNAELISDFMQDMTVMAKVSKFMASRLRDLGIPVTEKETWLDNETERTTLINFWVSLFKEYEKDRTTEKAERFCDPFQMPC